MLGMVPALHREAGFVFRFYPADGVEPPHVHVLGNEGFAKLWLVPEVRLHDSRGYSRRQVERLIGITSEHRNEWLARWREFFGRG